MDAAQAPGAVLGSGMLPRLHPEELAAFEARGRRRGFRAGSTLYHEGDDSDWVCLLRKGRVKVSSFSADGRESVFALLGPGELVGELSAIDHEPRSATVTALDPVEATVLTADAFRAFLTERPGVAVLLLETLSQRLRDSDRKRVEFGIFDTEARVARRLVEMVERFGEVGAAGSGSVRIDLPLTQEELAGWVGSSREAVSKALRSLRARGCITTQRRRITVLDLAQLRRRAR